MSSQKIMAFPWQPCSVRTRLVFSVIQSFIFVFISPWGFLFKAFLWALIFLLFSWAFGCKNIFFFWPLSVYTLHCEKRLFEVSSPTSRDLSFFNGLCEDVMLLGVWLSLPNDVIIAKIMAISQDELVTVKLVVWEPVILTNPRVSSFFKIPDHLKC